MRARFFPAHPKTESDFRARPAAALAPAPARQTTLRRLRVAPTALLLSNRAPAEATLGDRAPGAAAAAGEGQGTAQLRSPAAALALAPGR